MGTWLARVAASDTGQDLIEYALLAAFVALVSVGVITNLGTSVGDAFDGMGTSIEDSAGGP